MMTDSTKYEKQRRQFISQVASTLGVIVLANTNVFASTLVNTKNGGYIPKNLSPEELNTLIAVMARLIPTDLHTGGAVEAQAYVYVDQALGGYHSTHLQYYRDSLAALNTLAQQQGVAELSQLPAQQLDKLLAGLEQGKYRATITSPDKHRSFILEDGGRAFFNLILRHTVEGTFSDPMYGGNQNFIGWQILGYSGVQLYFSEKEQAVEQSENTALHVQSSRNRSIADYGGTPLL